MVLSYVGYVYINRLMKEDFCRHRLLSCGIVRYCSYSRTFPNSYFTMAAICARPSHFRNSTIPSTTHLHRGNIISSSTLRPQPVNSSPQPYSRRYWAADERVLSAVHARWRAIMASIGFNDVSTRIINRNNTTMRLKTINKHCRPNRHGHLWPQRPQ